MADTYYQIMIRIKDSFIPMIKDKLGIRDGVEVNETDYYLESDANSGKTSKLTVSGRNSIFEIVTKQGPLFQLHQVRVSAADRDAKISAEPNVVKIEKHRQLFRKENVEIAIDHIEELGTFLEIQGKEEAAVEAVCRKLGFTASQYIDHPYDWLKR